MQVNKPETYDISVLPNPAGTGVIVEIDGKKQGADGFEFSAPLGTGFAVREVVRVELVPETRRPGSWDRDNIG
jgi:hypothetical protein